MSYCETCPEREWCDYPCREYQNYVWVVSQCLKVGFQAVKSCDECPRKGDSTCPKYGAIKLVYEQLSLDTPFEETDNPDVPH